VEVNRAGLSFFQPLPEVAVAADNPVTDAKVDLGSKLFHDPRFSKSQTISCNSCHGLKNYGVDGTPNSKGFRDQRGDRNAPTVFNAALHLSQFWDGRAKDVEEQAKGPVLNPIEMAMPDADHVVRVIKSIPGYTALFAKAFPGEQDPVTYDNFGRAIGAFERKLLTPARWDEFLRGKGAALSDAEKQGFNKFVEAGCVTCHNGPAVGGALYQKLGLLKSWPGLKDDGRAKATKNEADKGFFKVPSLRNITQTGPYLHDGSVADLPTMVQMMAEHQLGRTLSNADVKSIVTFLEALTGKLPAKLIAEPELPKSGPNTPKADPT
jgi:cytochrome c peroxidase